MCVFTGWGVKALPRFFLLFFILGVDSNQEVAQIHADMKPIKTNKEAQAKLNTQILKVKAEIAGLKAELGIVNKAEKLEVENCPFDELINRTPRQWKISQLQHACRSLKWLNNTKKAELIFPDGKYLMVPKGTKVLSPSGFHPDEKVFLKPEQGCLVDVLPRSSNMGYHDFT